MELTQLIAMRSGVRNSLDGTIAIIAALALGLIWVKAYRPHKFKRVAITLGSTLAVLAVGVYTFMWYAANYMMDMI